MQASTGYGVGAAMIVCHNNHAIDGAGVRKRCGIGDGKRYVIGTGTGINDLRTQGRCAADPRGTGERPSAGGASMIVHRIVEKVDGVAGATYVLSVGHGLGYWCGSGIKGCFPNAAVASEAQLAIAVKEERTYACLEPLRQAAAEVDPVGHGAIAVVNFGRAIVGDGIHATCGATMKLKKSYSFACQNAACDVGPSGAAIERLEYFVGSPTISHTEVDLVVVERIDSYIGIVVLPCCG